MKLSKEKQQHLIAVVIGALVIIVALYFLVISGQMDKLARLDKDIEAVTDQVTKAERDIKNENIKLEMLAEATGQLRQLETGMLPTNEVYSVFLTTFNKFRQQYRDRVEMSVTGRERPAPLGMVAKFPYSTAVFTVRGTAHFHDFGRLVADLETQFPFYRIKQFSLSAGTAEAAQLEKLSFELEIVTLVRPRP